MHRLLCHDEFSSLTFNAVMPATVSYLFAVCNVTLTLSGRQLSAENVRDPYAGSEVSVQLSAALLRLGVQFSLLFRRHVWESLLLP